MALYLDVAEDIKVKTVFAICFISNNHISTLLLAYNRSNSFFFV